MLVPNQKFIIKIGGRTIKHYRELGYNDIKSRQELEIPVNHLMTCIHQMVQVVCDECGKTFLREYRDYLKLNKKHSKDLCHNCAQEKMFFEKYGVKNPIHVPEFKKKMEETNLLKYGTKCTFGSGIIRQKSIETCRNKYGADHYSQTEEGKQKIKETCLKRYGVEYYIGSKDRIEKTKKFFMDTYGVDNCNQVPSIKEKAKKTCLERYGAENPFGSKEIQEKIKLFWNNKYNVDYYSMTDDFKKKYYDTCMERYNVSTTLLLPEVIEANRKYWQKNYGVDYPLQSDKYWEEFYKKLSNNEWKIWTSKPQKKIYDLLKEQGYEPIENYKINRLFLDVALFLDNNIKIDIEYDGWYWHRTPEHKRKDRARDEVLKKLGWKILRIKGGVKTPSFIVLKEKIDFLISSEEHKFSQIIMDDYIDTSNVLDTGGDAA